MALNVGENFKQRWLATPESVRQTYCDELKFICALLEPDTQIAKWQHQEVLLQQRNRHRIDQAYSQLKQEILAEQARLAEERKRQRQAALEQALADKRAQQQAEIAAIEAQDRLKEQQQTEYLQQFAKDLQQQVMHQTAVQIARFDVTQVKQFNHNDQNSSTPVDKFSSSPQADDLKTRLELEAEYYIEQTLQQLREKLKAAAQEEIEIILQQQH
ncbi:MAG: hypothetical protein LKF82_08440 [Acinetobacter populi]|uniref:hypothetical protein n=1 Tax=Acinetobacter populi TaxID=1582270 RepID=UPI002354AF90|nr:hypothetical protein [Acinetobacter populi]MCH4247851.1 hypothetical protein [Acinetobacter populi]